MAKNVVTPEQREDARRLKAIYNAKAKVLGLTQEKLGIALGGSGQSTAGNYLNGITALNIKSSMVFSRELKVPISDFSPSIAKLIHEASPEGNVEENNIRNELIKLIDAYSTDQQQRLLDLAQIAFGKK